MANFATGIDDIATMSAGCSGWTIVSIDHTLLSNLNQNACRILQEARLPKFHGKEFKRKKINSYVNFLKLIRSTIESGPGFACCTLLGQDWKSQFEDFCNSVIGGSFSNAGIEAGAITEASKKLAAPLFTYQKLAAEMCGGGKTIIHIDRHALFDQLNSLELQVAGHIISSQSPIIAALRAYGRVKFPNAPEVDREKIFICPDEDSFLVQAADIIGNFATAYVFRHLRKDSMSNGLKCDVFEQAFGDIIDLETFPDVMRVTGDDLTLDAGAASFTFRICDAGA